MEITWTELSGTPLVRLDYANDDRWSRLLRAVEAASFDGVPVAVEIFEHRRYDGLSVEDVLRELPADHGWPILLAADRQTLTSADLPIQVVDLNAPAQRFRVIPEHLFDVEANLSLHNMDFEEFVSACDSDRIFRGFS